MSAIDLRTAEKIIEGARQKTGQLASNFCISVVDPRGDLVAMVKEDNTPWRSIFISQGKAAASAAFMRPSSALAENAGSPIQQGLMAMLGGRMIPGQGALPIYDEDGVIGAVGVSGGPSKEDEEVALAGIIYAGLKAAP